MHELSLGSEDEDWYEVRANDHLIHALKPSFTLIDYTEQPADEVRGPVTERIELCAFSALPAKRVGCQLGTAASFDGMAGCCAVATADNPDDVAELQMDVDSALHDDTSDVFVRVRPAGKSETSCRAYALGGRGYVF